MKRNRLFSKRRRARVMRFAPDTTMPAAKEVLFPAAESSDGTAAPPAAQEISEPALVPDVEPAAVPEAGHAAGRETAFTAAFPPPTLDDEPPLPARDKGNVPADRTLQPVFASRGVCLAAGLLLWLPLFVLGILSLCDTDPTVSATEKRALKTAPAFSLAALFDGSFSRDFEEYYADTFPFRETLLKLDRRVDALLREREDGSGIVAVLKPDNGDGGSGEALTEPTTPSTTAAPDTSPGEDATQPPVTETTTPPTQPPADANNNEVGVSENPYVILDKTAKSAMELYTAVSSQVQGYADAVNSLQAQLPDVQVYCLMAPTAVEFYAPDQYKAGNHAPKVGIDMTYERLADAVKTVDAYGALASHTNEYLYFRTDHHWTARGAYYAYTAFAQTAGFTPHPLASYDTGRLEGFVGTMYGYTRSELLADNPDYVEYFMPHTACTGQYFSDDTMRDAFALSVINTQIQGSSNKYLCFIQGDTPLARITTDNKNGKKILVIKESYGNALVPFLVDHYEEVYVVDPRKNDFRLPAFVTRQGIQEVLCVNYVFAPSNSGYMQAWRHMLGQ